MRWEAIDWGQPVPRDFLVPEHQYQIVHVGRLDRAARIHLNHLAVCFSCEQAIHLERVLIAYLERCRGALRTVPERHFVRFIAEERRHIEAFFDVLQKVRPDLYPTRELRLLRWTAREAALVRATPLVAFFLVAALFEECTLYIPDVMDERPEESFAIVRDVMRAHAREERGHVAIDERALAELGAAPRPWVAAQALSSLVLIAYVDHLVKVAWRRTVAQAARELGLAAADARALLVRRGSRSDLLGVAAFATRLRAMPLPGARALAAILARAVA